MRPPRFIYFLYAVDLALGALAVLGAVVAARIGIDGIDFVRLGVEANLPSWYSASQLLAVAALAAVAAWPRATSGVPGARWAFAPAAFFVLLSLDEGAQVHERLGDALQAASGAGSNLVTGPWLFLAVPLYGLLAWLVWRAIRPLIADRPRIVALSVGAGALFVAAAAGVEAMGNFFPDDLTTRRMLGVVEEVGEMAAATTFLWAAWALAQAEGVVLAVRPALSGDGAAPADDLPTVAARREPVSPG